MCIFIKEDRRINTNQRERCHNIISTKEGLIYAKKLGHISAPIQLGCRNRGYWYNTPHRALGSSSWNIGLKATIQWQKNKIGFQMGEIIGCRFETIYGNKAKCSLVIILYGMRSADMEIITNLIIIMEYCLDLNALLTRNGPHARFKVSIPQEMLPKPWCIGFWKGAYIRAFSDFMKMIWYPSWIYFLTIWCLEISFTAIKKPWACDL